MLLTRSMEHSPQMPKGKPQQAIQDSSSSNSDENDCETVAPTTLAERLEVVCKRFLHDVCSWTAFDSGQPLDAADVKRAARLYMAPDAVIHADSLFGYIAPPTMTGHGPFFDYIERERAAYQPIELRTLLVAVNEDQDTAFALSMFKMQSMGPWLGSGATGRVSEGIRIDELQFDSEAKILEAWCNRQLFQEERDALLRDPDHHHAATFDRSLLRSQVSEHEDGSHGPLAPHKMMQVASIWAELWNVATASGSLNPDVLDNLMEEDFALYDLLGLTGDDAEHLHHPYSAIRSRGDAKRILQELTDKYDVDESVVRMAARRGTNATFTHWRARMVRRTPESVAAREAVAADPFSVGQGPVLGQQQACSTGRAAGDMSFAAEATELLLFSPCGKLQSVYQFRRPLGSDRRAVLVPAPAMTVGATAESIDDEATDNGATLRPDKIPPDEVSPAGPVEMQ